MVLLSWSSTALARRIGRMQVIAYYHGVGVSLLVAMALLEDWVRPADAGNSTRNTTAAWSGEHPLCGADTCSRRLAAGLGIGAAGTAPPSGAGGAEGWAAPIAQSHAFRCLVVVTIYLVRTGVMNCTYPIQESVLMDFVPTEKRARWKSLDAICSFGWCGSAGLGGVLADRYGYGDTFLITAAVQAAGSLCQAALIFVVPKSEKPKEGAETAASRPPPAEAAAALANGAARAEGGVEPLLAGRAGAGDIQGGMGRDSIS
jgi:MFS family permease